MVKGTHKMIAGGFRGRVRILWRIRCLFRKIALLTQRAKYFVCRNMQETKRLLQLVRQPTPVGPRSFQQCVCSNHIRLNEIIPTEDGTVHMRLGRKMKNSEWLIFLK